MDERALACDAGPEPPESAPWACLYGGFRPKRAAAFSVDAADITIAHSDGLHGRANRAIALR